MTERPCTQVYCHAAATLVMSEDTERFLLNLYDSTYSVEVFRHHFNFIGGHSDKDDSPLATVRREVSEELGPDSPYTKAILENLEACSDYLICAKKGHAGRERDEKALVSVYVSRLSRELFARLEEDVGSGRQSTTEGTITIASLDDLKQGGWKGAWGYNKIMNDLLGTTLQEYDWMEATPLGKPRSSFAEYKAEFAYQDDPES